MAEPDIDTMSLSQRIMHDLLHPKPPSREMIRIQEIMKEMLEDTRPRAAPPIRVEAPAPVVATPVPPPLSKEKHRGKRVCEIHLLIKRVFYALREESGCPPTGHDVFRRIELRHKEYDTHGIIDEVRNQCIFWTSMRGYAQKMTFRTLENVVSKIRHGQI